MRGDSTERVRLDGSPSATDRKIYSVRSVPEQLLQFGTVTVDYGTVAVWRPFDPADSGHEAVWRGGIWRNVYRIRVPQHPIPGRPNYIEFAIDTLEIGGLSARLPVAQLELSLQLKEHLKAL